MLRLAMLLSLIALLAGGAVAVGGPRVAGAGIEHGDPPPAAEGLVGSWVLTITLPGEASDPHLATFHADGTFVETARPVQAAPPGAPFRTIFPSPGHGRWRATGFGRAELTFTRLLADETGTFLGTVPARATLAIDASGRKIDGSVDFVSVDPTGTVVGAGSGTVRGTPVEAEPVSTADGGGVAPLGG